MKYFKLRNESKIVLLFYQNVSRVCSLQLGGRISLQPTDDLVGIEKETVFLQLLPHRNHLQRCEKDLSGVKGGMWRRSKPCTRRRKGDRKSASLRMPIGKSAAVRPLKTLSESIKTVVLFSTIFFFMVLFGPSDNNPDLGELAVWRSKFLHWQSTQAIKIIRTH